MASKAIHTGAPVPNGAKKSLEVPPGMVTRGEVQRILGLSRAGTRKAESAGKLSATIDDRGRHLFLRTEVLELARIRGKTWREKDSGKTAARLFDLFEQGWELPAIVMETGESPTIVRALYEEYRQPLRRSPTSALANGDAGDAIRAAAADFQRAISDLTRRT
jgi:hypothetical protein